MPPEVNKLYEELWAELARIHLKWNDYRFLFADNPENFDVMNESAPQFFYDLQQLMWGDVLLHLCRITDRKKVSGKSTLTILKLADVITEPSLQKNVLSLGEDACAKTKFARDWRNRRLAHRELPPPNGQSSKPLAHASRQSVEDALLALRSTMNAVSLHYIDSTTAYEHSIPSSRGAGRLIFILQKGLEANQNLRLDLSD